MNALLLTLVLSMSAQADTPAPYYPRTFDSNQSMGGINENLIDITGRNKNNLVPIVRDNDCSQNNSLLVGAVEKGGYILGGSCTPGNAIGSQVAFSSMVTISGSLLMPAGSTITVNSLAPIGQSTPTANGVYANLLNQAYVVFVASNSAAQVLYSVGVTSVTYVSEGSYIVNWQRPFTTPYYFVHVTSQKTAGAVDVCMLNDANSNDVNVNMVSIQCSNQGPGVANPDKVFVMATGPQ